ncbi:hypothetical protein BV95_04070 [Sphingobium chlorophenolicum]|uniref:Uncharacterized protein n=1 Tax=Sphingobium chlorophenolicum TaxID=46429 RepID=A0A081R8W9_SPHCR|nr:hypothetical protein BV95_04070 [Sphingobium chlorophenolicum]
MQSAEERSGICGITFCDKSLSALPEFCDKSSLEGMLPDFFQGVESAPFPRLHIISVDDERGPRRVDGADRGTQGTGWADGRSRRDHRHRPAAARRGGRQHQAGAAAFPRRCPRAGRHLHCGDDQRIVAADQRQPGDPAERQADFQLFGDSGHTVRSGGAGRHIAGGDGAGLWLCADAEGGEHRAAPAFPRRDGGPARRHDDAGRARERVGGRRAAAHPGGQSLHPEHAV